MSVRIEKVTHWFGNLEVLRDVTLDVAEGEFVALLGRSGCGKTTLLNVVADLVKPTEGMVRVNGDSAESARKKREIGFIFQTPALLKNRSALGNVLLPMEIAGMNRKRAVERATAMLSLVGLQKFENYLPGQLSGGMRQRVSIARVFACDYQLILADEPFASLDALTKRTMAEELLKVWQTTEKRSTIIFVTHDEQEAAFLADRIVFMSHGPGRIQDVIPVGFPRPRTLALRKDPEFFRLTSSLLDLYAKEAQGEEKQQ